MNEVIRIWREAHLGHNIARIRELKGIKQEILAEKLGVSQQVISKLEHKKQIDDKKLKALSEALEVTPDLIKRFNEETAVEVLDNTSVDSVNGCNVVENNMYSPSFNPIDKIFELTQKNEVLYEKLLASEREKNEILVKANESIISVVEGISKLNVSK